MSKLMEVFAAYKDLSFTDRIVFYTTLSNNVNVHEDNLQDFLIETRINDGNTCIYCENQKENISLMFGQILSRRLTVHNSDISARPPLAFIT